MVLLTNLSIVAYLLHVLVSNRRLGRPIRVRPEKER